jgi:hypothetical protein
MFSELKTYLKRSHFGSFEDIQSNMTTQNFEKLLPAMSSTVQTLDTSKISDNIFSLYGKVTCQIHIGVCVYACHLMLHNKHQKKPIHFNNFNISSVYLASGMMMNAEDTSQISVSFNIMLMAKEK